MQGMSYKKLAIKYGLSKSRIGQILSKPEIKDVIDTGINMMISLVPLAVDVFEKAMKDETNPALALKAA